MAAIIEIMIRYDPAIILAGISKINKVPKAITARMIDISNSLICLPFVGFEMEAIGNIAISASKARVSPKVVLSLLEAKISSL